MSQKKETDKNVKVQDLAPKKDAKGGAARSADGSTSADGRTGLDGRKTLDGRSADGSVRNN